MSNRKGFTLIELLIVVVIIGILAAIAIPKFANTKEKAVVASMKSDLRNLVTAQEGFFSDNQDYAGGIARGPGERYRWRRHRGLPWQPGQRAGRELRGRRWLGRHRHQPGRYRHVERRLRCVRWSAGGPCDCGWSGPDRRRGRAEVLLSGR